jgi:hypothetical protein
LISFSNTIPKDEQAPLVHSPNPVHQTPTYGRFSFHKPTILNKWSRRFHGWKTGAITAATLALLSLLINFGVAIWLGSHNPDHSSLVEVYRGDCEKIERIDLWVHLAINALSTLLLGGSNYCMQCLSAPTRADIDKAHAKGKYLDVGVPSIRNIASVPAYKVVLWAILGLSSVPLHLMSVHVPCEEDLGH